MLGFFIGLLTVVMVLDCAFLILLVLVQLPKKEAGMGQAFGGAATDALFGAGSGNALTKMTKWAAGIFFGFAVLLTVLSNYRTTATGGSNLQKLMQQAPATPPPTTPAATPPPAAAPHNAPLDLKVPQVPASNVPAAATPTTTSPPSTAPATGTPAQPPK
jgi:preprotein translocase subunit SecG